MSTSRKSSLEVDTPSKVRVSLYGHGNIRSFKNHKQLIPAGKGRPARLITDKGKQKQMDGIIRDLLSLFISASQTNADGISMACSRQSLIASYLPGDDSRQWIPRILIECTDVELGDEGVDLTIERL